MVSVSFIQSVFTEKDSELAIEKVQRVSLFEKSGDEPLAQTDCSSDLPILRNRFHTSRDSSRISHVCNLSQATLARFVFMFFYVFWNTSVIEISLCESIKHGALQK